MTAGRLSTQFTSWRTYSVPSFRNHLESVSTQNLCLRHYFSFFPKRVFPDQKFRATFVQRFSSTAFGKNGVRFTFLFLSSVYCAGGIDVTRLWSLYPTRFFQLLEIKCQDGKESSFTRIIDPFKKTLMQRMNSFFEPFPFPLAKKKIKITTYNILDKTIVEDWGDRYDYVLEGGGEIDWEKRKFLVVHKMRRLSSDIFCLQEVSVDAFHFLEAHLPGYRGFYALDYGEKPCGIATFVKKSIPTLSTFFCLKEDPSKKKLARSALITTCKIGKEVFNICNTKMQWQPVGTPIDQSAAAYQINYLTKEIFPKFSSDRWLLVGDFNFEPSSPLADLLKKAGFIDLFENKTCWTCYVDMDKEEKGEGFKRVDYIFVSSSFFSERQQEKYKIQLLLPKPERKVKIPSKNEPSDHLPLSISFLFS